MLLKTFLEKYDYPGTVVLLEGKRDVAEKDISSLIAIGRKLAESTKYIRFRSGNASGADKYFIQGIHERDTTRTEVIIPFKDHNKKSITSEKVYSLDEFDLNVNPEVIRLSRLNQKTQNLIERYLDGMRNRITNKVAFIFRDTIKVTGAGELPPANFGIFYDDLAAPGSGGTGHTMEVCRRKSVPFIDQRIWMQWIM